MTWKLDGTHFETSSREVVCPCTASLSVGATYHRCNVTPVFHVSDGDVEAPARLSGIFHPAGAELTIGHATRSRMNAFGIEYEGKCGFSSSSFSWAA